MTMRRVLLTGAGGYVGGRLAQALQTDPQSTLRLLTRGAGLPGVETVTLAELGARTDSSALARAVEGIDTVLHLAALNEVECVADPARAIDVNITGTLLLAEAAKRAGVTRFVYMSTAHVYGAPLAHDVDESRVTRPLHPYAWTHRAAEDVLFGVAQRTAMRPIVLRLSNAVGAPARGDTPRWTLLANDLCRQAVTTGVLRLSSNGLAARDFIAMRDVIDAVRHFIDLPEERVGDGLYNLGSGTAQRVIDLAERIARRVAARTGRSPLIERPQPMPGETAPPLRFHVEKLRATGFSAASDLDAEIDETLALCEATFVPSPPNP